MIRRWRVLWAEYRVDSILNALIEHGAKCCAAGQPCHRWDQIAAHLDLAYDRLAKAQQA